MKNEKKSEETQEMQEKTIKRKKNKGKLTTKNKKNHYQI